MVVMIVVIIIIIIIIIIIVVIVIIIAAVVVVVVIITTNKNISISIFTTIVVVGIITIIIIFILTGHVLFRVITGFPFILNLFCFYFQFSSGFAFLDLQLTERHHVFVLTEHVLQLTGNFQSTEVHISDCEAHDDCRL